MSKICRSDLQDFQFGDLFGGWFFQYHTQGRGRRSSTTGTLHWAWDKGRCREGIHRQWGGGHHNGGGQDCCRNKLHFSIGSFRFVSLLGKYKNFCCCLSFFVFLFYRWMWSLFFCSYFSFTSCCSDWSRIFHHKVFLLHKLLCCLFSFSCRTHLNLVLLILLWEWMDRKDIANVSVRGSIDALGHQHKYSVLFLAVAIAITIATTIATAAASLMKRSFWNRQSELTYKYFNKYNNYYRNKTKLDQDTNIASSMYR